MTHLFGTLVHIHILPPYSSEHCCSCLFTYYTQITPSNRLKTDPTKTVSTGPNFFALEKFFSARPISLYTSMNTHIWITRIIMGLVSLFQATTLRDRYYTLQERNTILETAIEDIARINAAADNNRLIKGITDRLRND
jgi:hypothetical protein